MNLLPVTIPKTFSLLSIGQRGVGKTVFLTGSYAELHANIHKKHPQELWFDCQDQVQENIEKFLNYIVQTGQYPPPTMKVTNFNFSLKHHSLRGERTLCHFRWWDIPGEICKPSNQDFRKIVSTSHGCCVFIDAYALIHNQTYLQELEEIAEMVVGLASLVSLSDLKYAFALILTKYDQLKLDSFSQQQLEAQLQPLTTRLDVMKANYQVFYSSIPIIHRKDTSILSVKGAAAPLLWLVWELCQAHNQGWVNNLLDSGTHLWSNSLQLQQDLPVEDGSPRNLFRPWDLQIQKSIIAKNLLTARRNLLLQTVAIISLITVISIFAMNYKQLFPREPKKSCRSEKSCYPAAERAVLPGHFMGRTGF